jgi:tagatose 1,6-diphosphate aldolase GatY/KbaY
VYAVKPRLDTGRLEQIRAAVDIPLVLHGASGLTPEDVRACVARGVCKVNFATELRAAYTEGVRETFAENPRAADPKIYGAAGREKVRTLVSRWIAALGCEGRA